MNVNRILFVIILLLFCGVTAHSFFMIYDPELEVGRAKFETEDGVSISGIYALPPDLEENAPVVVVLHGFNSMKERMLTLVYDFAHRGMVSIAIDLRGHKSSSGTSRFGMQEYLDVSAALDWARDTFGADASRSAVVGTSMGATTAVMSGCMDPRIQAVVEISGFTRLSKVVTAHPELAQFYHIPDIQRYSEILDFAPIEYVDGSHPKNLLIVHGTTDELVPFDQAIELYEKASIGAIEGTREFKSYESDHGVWHYTPEAYEYIVSYVEGKLGGKPSDILSVNRMPWLNRYLFIALPALILSLIPLALLLGKRIKKDAHRYKNFRYLPAYIAAFILCIALVALVPSTGFSTLISMLAQASIPLPFLILVLIYLEHRKNGVPLSDFGLSADWRPLLLSGALLAYLLLLSNVGAYLVYAPMLMPRWNIWSYLLQMFFYLFALELFFRGIVQSRLSARIGDRKFGRESSIFGTLAIQALVIFVSAMFYFSLLGFDSPTMFAAMSVILPSALGIFNGYIYHSTKSVLATTLFSTVMLSLAFSTFIAAV